jgi:putative hydrolase of the HAD superfamily
VIGTPTSEIEEVELLQGFWTYVSDKEGLDEEVRQELFAFDYLGVIRPFADAQSALKYCKQVGLKVGVLSNFSLATLGQSLQVGGLAQWVDYAAAAPVIGYAKPQAESYYHVAQKLGVLPEECLLLDDDPSYVAGARTAGMKAYLVNRRLLHHDLANNMLHNLTALPIITEQYSKEIG